MRATLLSPEEFQALRAAPPCALCGTTEGWRSQPHLAPARYHMDAHGMQGVLCKACWHAHYYERLPETQERRRMAGRRGYGTVPPLTTRRGGRTPDPSPCVLCAATHRTYASGARFGVEGRVCRRCYQRLQRTHGGTLPPVPGRPGRPPTAARSQPCGCCGATPTVCTGGRYGVEGRLCERCYQRLYRRKQRGPRPPRPHKEQPTPRSQPPAGSLTVQQAAAALGLSRVMTNALIVRGILPATKYGKAWAILPADLETARNRPDGRRERHRHAAPEMATAPLQRRRAW